MYSMRKGQTCNLWSCLNYKTKRNPSWSSANLCRRKAEPLVVLQNLPRHLSLLSPSWAGKHYCVVSHTACQSKGRLLLSPKRLRIEQTLASQRLTALVDKSLYRKGCEHSLFLRPIRLHPLKQEHKPQQSASAPATDKKGGHQTQLPDRLATTEHITLPFSEL